MSSNLLLRTTLNAAVHKRQDHAAAGWLEAIRLRDLIAVLGPEGEALLAAARVDGFEGHAAAQYIEGRLEGVRGK